MEDLNNAVIKLRQKIRKDAIDWFSRLLIIAHSYRMIKLPFGYRLFINKKNIFNCFIMKK